MRLQLWLQHPMRPMMISMRLHLLLEDLQLRAVQRRRLKSLMIMGRPLTHR